MASEEILDVFVIQNHEMQTNEQIEKETPRETQEVLSIFF